MQKKTIVSLSVLLGCLLILPGCRDHLKYRRTHLEKLNSINSSVVIVKDNVTLFVKKFNAEDCLRYFNKKDIGTQVIQLGIHNKSDEAWIFGEENINVPLLKAEKVSKNLHAKMSEKIFLGLLNGLTRKDIDASVINAEDRMAHKAIDEDINEKSFFGTLTVFPRQYESKLLYVAKDANLNSFSITLINDEDAHKLISYNISL